MSNQDTLKELAPKLKEEALKLHESGETPKLQWEEVTEERVSPHALMFGGDGKIQALIGYQFTSIFFDIFIKRDWDLQKDEFTVAGQTFEKVVPAMLMCELLIKHELAGLFGEKS